jgi:polyisoprenoid-binding protein YceI
MRELLFVCTLAALTACSQQASDKPGNIAASTAAAKVPAGVYTLDKSHASLIFRVNHLGFSNYTARFKRFDAQLQFDPANFALSSVNASIDPRSLDLDNPPPGFTDTLLGEQWLNANQYPEMILRSTKIEATGSNTFRIIGDFTLHGVTKPIVLHATFNGGYEGHPMDPHARVGFSAQGSLKRADFGIAFGIPAPGTTMGVGDNVDVIIEAEFSGPPLIAKPSTEPIATK